MSVIIYPNLSDEGYIRSHLFQQKSKRLDVSTSRVRKHVIIAISRVVFKNMHIQKQKVQYFDGFMHSSLRPWDISLNDI